MKGGGAIQPQLELELCRKTGVPKDNIFADGFVIFFLAVSSHLSLDSKTLLNFFLKMEVTSVLHNLTGSLPILGALPL